MAAPLTLPRLCWGDPSSARRVLLVHGLGSSGALMWRLGDALGAAGWHATAIDLRGHGDAPRALDYSVQAYGEDLVSTLPADGGRWDAVVGHSLGGAASTVAAASSPEWTARLVLLDPAILVGGRDAAIVRKSQERAFADNRIELVRQEHPHWHPQDWELKVDAVHRTSAWAVEQTSVQNTPWDVTADAARLTVPTHVIGSDPGVYSIFTGEVARSVLAANPLITMSVVEGAGHSLHRDRPEEAIRQLKEALA
ncbi:alpha/beta fold hydrolase [Microbacterium hydrocarbonoxydans]|uniref:alpha/beta fold hydrolase n=1 Tax=Microbacterium hydrocarbonoxydans TaxID=273678 RepID=UPI0020426A82|nr:alpha/beta hydrolase [Microbacterium hydrocarbonoxydans]MCM3780124.1 alpha/beta hydrolase [Microbacterium hydrocarbonoxydans]